MRENVKLFTKSDTRNAPGGWQSISSNELNAAKTYPFVSAHL